MADQINNEVIHMLKNGVDPQQIQSIVQQERRKSYSPVFIDFMQDMIDKYKVKRTEIARITGLSQDYLYKVLNGTKKTAEKDYVVAICIAIGMNVPETQHALEINGMPLLSIRDLREYIILTSISDGKSFYKTNDWLESAGYPMLRVSKDMPQYVPRLSYSGIDEEFFVPKKRRLHEVSRDIHAEQCGDAPFDYAYWANIVVEDEQHQTYHVQAYFHPEFTAFSTIDEENYQKHEKSMQSEEEINWETIEEFETLDEAYESEFFRYYLEADKATDEKVKEIYTTICDTVNYGVRCGLKIGSEGLVRYAEQYDAGSPADKQYFQVVETDSGITYSASHESVFMYIELEDCYSAIFGERDEPQYFIRVTTEEELQELPMRTKFILKGLRTTLHQWMQEQSGFGSDLKEQDVQDEEIESIAQAATWSYLNGDYETALALNQELLGKTDSGEAEDGCDHLAVRIVTTKKIATCYEQMGDLQNTQICRDKILEYKERINEAIEQNKEGINNAVSVYAEELLHRSQEAQDRKDIEAVTKYLIEIIHLLENRCDDKDSWGTLFAAYVKYAFILDEINRSDLAIDYYEKADDIVRQQHLEDGLYRSGTMSFYNNYAWVLWNRFENQEAIIYYGKAIELAEDALYFGLLPEKTALDSLEHYGKALYHLYQSTGKDREAEHLLKRLRKNNVQIEQ